MFFKFLVMWGRNVHRSIGTCRGYKRASEYGELELQTVLGTKLSPLQEQHALLTPEPSPQCPGLF